MAGPTDPIVESPTKVFEDSPNVRAALKATAAEFRSKASASTGPGGIRSAWETAVLRHFGPAMALEAAAETIAVAQVSNLAVASVSPDAVTVIAAQHLDGLVAYGDLIEAAAQNAADKGCPLLDAVSNLVTDARLAVVADRTIRQLRNGIVTLVLAEAESLG